MENLLREGRGTDTIRLSGKDKGPGQEDVCEFGLQSKFQDDLQSYGEKKKKKIERQRKTTFNVHLKTHVSSQIYIYS